MILKFCSVLIALTFLLPTNIFAEENYSSEKIGFGQGRQCDENNRPLGAINFNAEYSENFDSYAFFEDRDEIVLSFDQGYENGYTEKILDTLKEKDVKAVFFLTGDYAKKNKALVERMILDGHILGNHGMGHKSLPELSSEETAQEIMDLHNMILTEYNYKMEYFRPPCGEYSELALSRCKSLGYKTLFWSFAYADWDVNNQPDVDSAFDRVSTASHNGAVYLLHSVSSTNAQILPDVIDKIRNDGFKFGLPPNI